METFWTVRLIDVIGAVILIVTIFAIYFGPIRAVTAATKLEQVREAERRKREIFATLMRTRRTYMNPDHVAALNLIQLEFRDYPSVLNAFKDYILNLCELPPSGPALDAFLRRRDDLFFDLLHALANAVGCDVDKRDLERLAYVPIGWANDENELRLFRKAMIELLHGRRALPIAPFQPQASFNPYPPPPGATSPDSG